MRSFVPSAASSASGSTAALELDFGSAPLLDWLPDETLFSLCSRQHSFWGYGHSWNTAKLLFGGRASGTHHDFPNCLDQLLGRVGPVWGPVGEIAESRTLLRFYRPFLSMDEVRNAIAAMRSPSVAHLKMKLGILTSRFRANHPLKSCPICRGQDEAEQGCSYWHLMHQYPGVWACHRHGVPLEESLIKSSGVGRFLWALPAADKSGHRALVPDDGVLARWQSLAEFTVALANSKQPPGWLYADRIQEAMLAEVRHRGWMTSGYGLRIRFMADDFYEYCRAFKNIREFDGLPQTLTDAERHLGRLLRPLRTGTHPLRLITAAHWLFGKADSLHAALEGHDDRLKPETEGERGRPEADPSLRQEALTRLVAGTPPSAVAREMGVDVRTAQAWAAQQGIEVRRRASLLRPDKLADLKTDLESGMEKAECAARSSVSVSTVNRILRTEVGLHSKWQQARNSRARSSARGSWEELREVHGHQGIKFMRAVEPAVYAWLYRNDLAWLRENQPETKLKQDNGSRLSWDARDLALKAAVDVAVLAIRESAPGRSLKLWQVYQLVPDLKAKLAKLDRMPLTSKALERALAKPKVRLR